MPAAILNAELIEQLARLRAGGLAHEEIRKKLEWRISQPTIARGIQAALQQGLLRIQFVPREHRRGSATDFVSSSLDHDVSSRLSRCIKSGEGAQRVLAKVVQLGKYRTREEKLLRFCERAASHVGPLLATSEVCGTSWGGTLKCLMDHLEPIATTRTRHASRGIKTTVIPLCGDPLGASRPTSQSSSSLAERLARLLNGKPPRRQHDLLSLALVPAFFPLDSEFTEQDVASAWKLISHSEAYKSIFGGHDRPNPLIHRIDTVLTAISDEGTPYGFDSDPSVIDSALRQQLIGDIGGVPLERPDLSRADKALLGVLDKRWTGVRAQDLQRCARRAGKRGASRFGAGVIVMALGEPKAKCVVDAARRGLVNHVVMDEEAAKRILKLPGT